MGEIAIAILKLVYDIVVIIVSLILLLKLLGVNMIEKVILYILPLLLLLANGLIFCEGVDDDNVRLAMAVNVLIVCLVIVAEVVYLRRKKK